MPEAVQDPRTPEDWQDAANMAEALLKVESTRAYGLITGGPEVNQDRCDEVLERAKAMGIFPQARGVEAIIGELIGGGT